MNAKRPDLTHRITYVLDECRMVLPGIQALFGFQLIAVFNTRFEHIPFDHQVAHLIATGLVALAAAVVMAPAAYHRSVEPYSASEHFIRVSTHLLRTSMLFLGVGIAIDFFVIAMVILDNPVPCTLLASGLFIALAILWFVYPNWKRK